MILGIGALGGATLALAFSKRLANGLADGEVRSTTASGVGGSAVYESSKVGAVCGKLLFRLSAASKPGG